jgi:hypothetical protein
VNDVYTVDEGGTLTVPAPGVFANDTYDDLTGLSAFVVNNPSYGSSFNLNTDGSFTYVHNGGESGNDKFTYWIIEGFTLSNIADVTINVTAVNDAPVLNDISSSSLSFTENGSNLNLCPLATINDADDSNMESATIDITSALESTDVLAFNPGSTGINGSYDAGTGLLQLTGSATKANYQTALRSVTYRNTSENPNTTNRAVSIYVSDGGPENPNSNTLLKTVSITAINDAPVLANLEATALVFTEGTSPVQVTNTITVTDIDNATLSYATVSVSSNYQNDQDVLAFTNDNGLTGTFNIPSGTLTITGAASPETYQAALRTVTYENTSTNPLTSARTLTFTVHDGTAPSAPLIRNLTIIAANGAPVLADPSSAPVSYTEGGPTVQLTNSITITDGDNTNMASATVSITSGFQTTEDILTFTPSGGISGSYNNATGVLAMTGTATTGAYRNTLRSVRYSNASEAPTVADRTISFMVNDGTSPSNTINKTVTITAVNDNPVLAGIEGSTLAFTEGDVPVQITSTITVTDIDNASLQSAVVTVSSNYQSDQDVLSFVNAYSLTGSWNPGSGQLTLTGPTTLANFQAALRTVKFNNTSANPNTTNRVISFVVSDGTGNSNLATRTVSVANQNNGPVLTDPSSSPVSFTEGGAAVRLTNTITVTDDDNTNLVSATITILTGHKSPEDMLTYISTGGINGTYNSTTGVLPLTGNTSLANYQTVLRSIRYINNNNDAPDTADRVITITVNDGTSNSNVINKTVLVIGVNDPPEATDVIITATNDKVGTLNTGSFTFTDPDNDAEGIHTYKWYRSDFSNGTGAVAINGATGKTYRPVKADGGKFICFEVTPKDEHNLAGSTVKSAFRYINAVPVASNVVVYGANPKPGTAVKGRFTYYDKEANARGVGIYQWYRTTTSNPSVLSPGTGIGTDSTYQVKSADAGKYIWFRVTPVALAGSTPGDSVWSNVIGPIGEFSANISGSDTVCFGSVMPIKLTITSGKSPYSAILKRTGSTSNKDTTVTNITTSPRNINVKIGGTYTLTKLTDDTGDTAAVAASAPVVLVVNPKSRAIITGTTSICNDGESRATLYLDFQTGGVPPWTVKVRRTENELTDTTFENITEDPFDFKARVISSPTRHRVVSITDGNDCPGDTASGSAWISYKASPIATISGTDTICPGSPAIITVTLDAGTAPWSFTYLRNGSTPTQVTGINTSSYTLTVNQIGTYTISEVRDATPSVGCGSGEASIVAYTPPTAVISGNINICEHTSGNLSVALTGKPQWRYSYKFNGGAPVEVLNVGTSPNLLPVTQAGTYTLYEVYDLHCKSTIVSGSGTVTVNPAPDVTISGLEPAYDIKSFEIDTIIGTPPGGTFSGPGVYGFIFIPRLAPVGTHNIVYTYRASPGSCYGYDTTVVSILEADAIINFENKRTRFCQNDKPFTVTGVNLAGVVGNFTISGGRGIYNIGNNQAIVKPAELEINKYTIYYNYVVDGAQLQVPEDFDVGKKIGTSYTWATECFHTGQPITFKNNTVSDFGYLTDTSFIWNIPVINGTVIDTTKDLNYTFSDPGNYVIKLVVQNTYGCIDTLAKTLSLRPTVNLGEENYEETFEDPNNVIGWQTGSLGPVNSWTFGNPAASDGFLGSYSGSHCWYTDINASPAPAEQSFVTSPCFNFTGMDKPMLSLRIWRIFNSNRDGANIQASADSGRNWIDIGELHDGIDWYNSYDIRGKPGNVRLGWSNNAGTWNDTDWKRARHSLDMLKEKSEVQFRVSYGSADFAQNNKGIAFDDFSIVERTRMSLVEHFTNSTLESCELSDAALDGIVQDFGLNMIDIQYHTSTPAGDPFYDENPKIPTARLFYYGISAAPYTLIDGGTKAEHRFDESKAFDKNAAIIQSLEDCIFDIRTESDISESILNVNVYVTAQIELPLQEYSIRIAVIERVVDDVVGANGDTLFRNVVKAMLPGAAGTTVRRSWSPLNSFNVEGQWGIQHVSDESQLRIVAFIQNETTKEVYQAKLDTIGTSLGTGNPELPEHGAMAFVVYPNPASAMANVAFNDEMNRDVTIQLFNNMGKLVYSVIVPAGTHLTEIPLEKYPGGLYLLRFLNNQKILGTSKIIISR